MTDKEKEDIFKSILDFEDFFSKVEFREDLFLTDNVQIKFNSYLIDTTDVYLNNKIYSLSTAEFLSFINELKSERLSQNLNEIAKEKKLIDERLRNDIIKLENSTYKIHKEYIETMYFASDVASAHGQYLKKLEELIKIFNHKSTLYIEEKVINSKNELLVYLKSYGFQFVEKDSQ